MGILKDKQKFIDELIEVTAQQDLAIKHRM